jgi:hypothetical protein
MSQILSTSEILGTINLPQGECEVMATAKADYSTRSGNLVVALEACARSNKSDEPLDATWLPDPENVAESVEPNEAGEVARDVFRSWVRKVRAAAPPIHNPTF